MNFTLLCPDTWFRLSTNEPGKILSVVGVSFMVYGEKFIAHPDTGDNSVTPRFIVSHWATGCSLERVLGIKNYGSAMSVIVFAVKKLTRKLVLQIREKAKEHEILNKERPGA